MNLKMKGDGAVEKPNDGAIEMKNPMEDLVEITPEDVGNLEDVVGLLEVPLSEDIESPEIENDPVVIDSREAPIEELLPESNKPGFDASEVQDARRDDRDEGGVTRNKTTGPMKSSDPAQEGGLVRKEPLADSTANAYEVSGFHVEVPFPSGMVSQQITQDFADLDTAKASVNGDKFILQMKDGYKACRITRGAPIICFNERQVLEYINGAWRKP